MDGGRIRDKRESYGLSVKLMYFFAFYVFAHSLHKRFNEQNNLLFDYTGCSYLLVLLHY
jgi:hypothetical protein